MKIRRNKKEFKYKDIVIRYYDQKKCCDKCGSIDINNILKLTTKWIFVNDYPKDHMMRKILNCRDYLPFELIERFCRNCKNQWYELPLDFVEPKLEK